MVSGPQPYLRLIKSEHLDLCSLSSFNAASPRGSDVRPVSMSLTEEGANSTSAPISASVSPEDRRSDMREAHVVMPDILRRAVDASQRPTVTALRENTAMPRPQNLTKLDTVGARIKWWREHRGFKRSAFAKMVGMSYSGLADLENGRSKEGKQLHIIAAKLRLNPYYLQTDKGEPEAEFAQEPPADGQQWPFQSIPPSKMAKLNMIELSYAENKLQEALAEIEAERRKSKKTG